MNEEDATTQNLLDSHYHHNVDPNKTITFRQCIKLSQSPKLKNQVKIFMIMAAFWIFSSFFISIEFYLFKKPQYCFSIQSDCCSENNSKCIQDVCATFKETIKDHIVDDNSLTYQFGLFCHQWEWVRISLKILPESLSIIGMLIYGTVADRRGRKTALKICWRMYTFGVILFATTNTMPLRILGYSIASIHCYPSLICQFTLLFELNIQKSRKSSSLLLLACLFVGPLILSFISSLLLTIDTRIILTFLCAVPALVLSLLTNKLHQSPIFTYPFDKVHAFNILNRIAQQNQRLPILIDLSRSHWHKLKVPEGSFFTLLQKGHLTSKLLIGFFTMFTIYLTIKASQISLDPFTQTYTRSIMINIPTSLADLTLCLFFNKFLKIPYKIFFFINSIITVAVIIIEKIEYEDNDVEDVFRVILAIILRYVSELLYGLVLIWAIETFPTINRSYCVGIVMGGISTGVIVAYVLKTNSLQLQSLVLACNLLVLIFSNVIELNSSSRKMFDTFEGQQYDQHDSFFQF